MTVLQAAARGDDLNAVLDLFDPQPTAQSGEADAMSLRSDIDRVKEARAYMRDHFVIDRQTHVGHMKATDFDAVLDRIVEFADRTLVEQSAMVHGQSNPIDSEQARPTS